MITQQIQEYGPDFGLPLQYQILATNDIINNYPITVHHSRMIRYIGIQQPYFQKAALMMWGISVLENLKDRIEAYDMISTSINQLSNKAHLRTLKIEGLRENIAMGGEAFDDIMSYVQKMRLSQTSEGITLLDSLDQLEMQGYNFAGLAEILNLAGEQIAGAAGIPQSLFFGRQADGLGASHEGDIQNFYSVIHQKREHELRRPFTKIIQIIAQSKGIKLDEQSFSFTFDQLWDSDEIEIAEIAKTTTDTLVALVSNGIISVEEARTELHNAALITKMFGSLEIGSIPEMINSTNTEKD
jgi:phage-related protein (TIGR01555 family)